MCGLCGDAIVFAIALIGYDDMELLLGQPRGGHDRDWLLTLHRQTTMLDLCTARLVVTIHDLLLASFPGWHGRSSASVAYLFYYSDIIAILHSLRSGSCTYTWYVMVRFVWWIYCSTTLLDQSGLKLITSSDWIISLCSISFMYMTCPYCNTPITKWRCEPGSRRRILDKARIHKYMHTSHNNNSVLNIKLLQFKGLNSIHQNSCSEIINDKRKLILSTIHERHHALTRRPQQQSMPMVPLSTGPNRQESGPPTGTALSITEREREATCTQ
jgi:hypothetical protein